MNKGTLGGKNSFRWLSNGLRTQTRLIDTDMIKPQVMVASIYKMLNKPAYFVVLLEKSFL